eukprot:CAMPEP_0115210540 /NCGR_PEP_ID=MMETSP0270-20121206/22301_1 /TAXON_ID=71861 /ORGANISM="Scrippsiella trochoidea, Strain CCMP3099" /LENGTH=262 /DNA_ID=CAMNT_0002624201 /DNA_START=93 /DNA_END=879 /DNA_ORIENTATION=+
MGKKSYQNYGKTFRKPKRPFEKERLDSEMKIIGEYGLKNKREVWRARSAQGRHSSARLSDSGGQPRAMGKKSYQNYGKTFRKPKRPFEKERLDSEMKIIGEYGLKNKREVWRVNYALAKIRTAARTLLTLDEKSEQRMFQGDALLRRMIRLGLLLESEKKLDYVLGLTTAKIMERRLQTKVFKLGLAKSIHHARTLIRQRHIRVGKQICDIPSFLVRLDSEKHIDFALTSPFGGGRPGRVRRKARALGAAAAAAATTTRIEQ